MGCCSKTSFVKLTGSSCFVLGFFLDLAAMWCMRMKYILHVIPPPSVSSSDCFNQRLNSDESAAGKRRATRRWREREINEKEVRADRERKRETCYSGRASGRLTWRRSSLRRPLITESIRRCPSPTRLPAPYLRRLASISADGGRQLVKKKGRWTHHRPRPPRPPSPGR